MALGLMFPGAVSDFYTALFKNVLPFLHLQVNILGVHLPGACHKECALLSTI